ncbi:MAG: HAMP domain-containing sensor histidine kinase, partial [Anaerolineaceae bacterium]|nr:HAMP domain-containing sensor histidine kinase [Anaerolineaceae bacterium]
GDHCTAALSNAQLHTAALAALEAKNDFISFILHELKNPITSISGYADLLAGGSVGAVTEIQAKYLNTIRANAARLFTLVSDLMDLSRIEEGQMRLDFGSFEPGDIIAEVVVSHQPQLDEKHQLLELNLPDGLPLVRTDRKRLYQVLTNLVNNAQKFTPQDGRIVISSEAATNQWDERGAPRVVHVWVQDNGIGIRPEDVGEVFKKFYRAEDPLVQRIPGTGLGLHITKYLVEALGGRIWFESEYQQGTTFHITIPVAG